jgi:8-oxo-dGTP diphosphatase
MSDMKCINVVAAFLPKNRKVMIVQRNETGNEPLKWEFPGGKLIGDETFDEALLREFEEEFGINVNIIQEVGSADIETANEIYLLMFILVEGDIKDLKLKIHKELKFASFDELVKLDLCQADRIFITNYEKEIKKYID